MAKNKLKDNSITDEIYTKGQLSLGKYIGLAFILLFLGYFLNMPLEVTLKNLITKNLSTLKSCPITFDDIKFEYLLPKVIVVSPTISGRCFNQPSTNLSLENILINFQGLSFYPFGIKFNVNIKKDKSLINIYPVLSFSKSVIKISDTNISDTLVASLTGKNYVNGDLRIDGIIEVKGQEFSSLKFNVKSNNIVVPSQNINGFDVPTLNIGDVSIKGDYDGNKVFDLTSLIIGNDQAPLMGQMKGKINVNKYNMMFSTIDLNAEVKFTSQFLSDFSILNLLLSGKEPQNGFYKLRVGGSFIKPSPTFL